MPYSDRARYTHEETHPRPKGIVRIRTVRAGNDEVRIGYDRQGKSAVVSILRPKGSAKRRRRAGPRPVMMRAHPHSRGEHGGKCSRA